MSLSAAERAALRRLARGRDRKALEALFALIKRAPTHALMDAALPSPKRTTRAADTLIEEVNALFKPLLAPASEKADLLIEACRALPGGGDCPARGLVDAVRRLSARHGEAAVRKAAHAVMSDLSHLSMRETVT